MAESAQQERPGGAGALPEQWGLFHDLLEAAPDALLVVDHLGRIVFSNARTEALLGYAKSELIGQSIDLLVPSGLRAQHAQHRAGYAAAPRKRPMGSGLDLAAVRKDGVEIPVEISLSPLPTPSGVLISAAIRDISHRIDIERELRRARAQAEQASTAKSRFLAAASHDLRQPLQAALLYANVLGRQVGDAAAGDIVRKLHSSLDALRDLLNRLLDISRLEAGAVAPEIGVVLLRLVFERLRDEFAPQAAEKGLELHIRAGDWKVSSDPQLLEQLLRNLVSNALRYTEDGRVLVGCRRAGKELRIQVWDTGIGIPAEELSAIFEEFYQVANAERRRQAGLGLGLAIVRRLSQLLGHPVAVRSQVGRGSVFEVTVPLSVGNAARVRARAHPPAARRRALVLVIEDDEEVLDGLRLSIEQAGHRVIAASDVDAVLRGARAVGGAPDLIVSDYRLGANVTGPEAIGRLRRELGASIPAIVVTGDSSSEAQRAVSAAGFTLMHKPVDPEQLEDAIARAIAAPERDRSAPRP